MLERRVVAVLTWVEKRCFSCGVMDGGNPDARMPMKFDDARDRRGPLGEPMVAIAGEAVVKVLGGYLGETGFVVDRRCYCRRIGCCPVAVTVVVVVVVVVLVLLLRAVGERRCLS